MKVLVVEPDRVHQQLYKELASKVGVALLMASSAAEAMKLLEAKPSLVICELSLPDMDGLDLVGYLRNRPDTCDTRVILATSLEVDCEMERALSLKILEYWPKPLDMRLCHRQLRQVLCRNNISVVDLDEVVCRLEISERLYVECLEMLEGDLRAMPAKLRTLKDDPHSQRAYLTSTLGACASLGFRSLAQLLRRLDYCYENDMKEAGNLLLNTIQREHSTILGVISAIRRNWLIHERNF
ncbi:response regulator [bacterium]|nr:response regulator [bacterium]